MPVSKISTVGCRSANPGAGRWMGQRSVSAGMGAPSSIGSPIRLNSRPSVTSPTGTVMA